MVDGISEQLRREVREGLTPVMRAHEFKGSAPSWRRTAPNGDCAIVNVQTMGTGSFDERCCIVHIAVVPVPWLQWIRSQYVGDPPKAISYGEGLYSDSLGPTKPRNLAEERGRLWVVDSSDSVRSAVADMAQQLITTGLPICIRLLERANMIATIKDGNLGFVHSDGPSEFLERVLAIVISDDGPSTELDGLLRRIKAHERKYGITDAILQNMIDFARARSNPTRTM